MRDELEAAAKAWDSWERFVTVIVMFAMFGFGAYLVAFPERLPEDFPAPRIVGGVLCGVSGLFLMAILGRGGFASRAKNLLLFLVFGAIAGAAGYATWGQVEIVHGLKTEGVERTLPVASNGVRMVDGTPITEVVLMDGERRIVLDWNGRIDRGTMVTVLTHPEQARWTAATPAGSSYLEIVDALEYRWSLLIAAAVTLLMAPVALMFLVGFITGSAAPDEVEGAA